MQIDTEKLRRHADDLMAVRHNVRDLDTLAQMTVLTKGLDQKRLRYVDLVV